MPVFDTPMRKIDYSNSTQALKTMENHIRSMQEQLEYTLANLDSSNVTEISTDKTNITSSDGSVTISGEAIDLQGKSGERFRVGYDSTSGLFRFEVSDKSGSNVIYLDSSGNLILTSKVTAAIDCGTW